MTESSIGVKFHSQWGEKNLSESKKMSKFWGVDKIWNMEHSGTSRNIPEHRIIIIIMRKICKINCKQLNETKINWYQLGKLKEDKIKTKT